MSSRYDISRAEPTMPRAAFPDVAPADGIWFPLLPGATLTTATFSILAELRIAWDAHLALPETIDSAPELECWAHRDPGQGDICDGSGWIKDYGGPFDCPGCPACQGVNHE